MQQNSEFSMALVVRHRHILKVRQEDGVGEGGCCVYVMTAVGTECIKCRHNLSMLA